nr:uncharacterized protein LOC106680865 isoform X2 [Halyomorpha halys]
MNPEKVLPPGVNGKITGYLMVKVDEIFWARNSPGEVIVQLQWWGEKDCTLFWPEDITLNEPKKNSDTSVIYNIRTSPGLFESYLRNCGRITFTVLRGQNKNVILGSVVIKEVEQILALKNYHSYFSIFSPKGHRIGDLHVSFELTFKQIGSRPVMRRPIEESLKVKSENNHKISYSDQLSSNKCKSDSPIEDKFFSNILQKGYELRKAMVMSVLADCPIDHIDSVVNCDLDLNFMKQCSQEEEVKLVDFLLGKHMSPEEEVKALKTLRCISPAENLVDIAKVDSKEVKLTKSKCCLHGQDCREENIASLERKDEKSEPVSLKTNSTSSTDLAQTRESIQLNNDENVLEKKEETKFNCYRITISSLKLSLDGSRKIFYVPGHNHNPPGTYFFLEIKFPSKGEFSSRSIKFVTKKLKGQCVDFDQGSSHRLCGSVTWPRVCSVLNGSVFNISWRHLNQRVPCPLGSAKLEKLNSETGAHSASLCLPIYSNTRLLTGHLNVTITLGMLDNLKGIFHITKKPEENLEDVHELDCDNLSSKVNPEMLVESLEVESSSSHSDRPAAVNSEEAFPVTRLDEEILRTIDLLNSKTDGIVNKNPVVEKHEACVQTTLPFTETDCFCHCQKPVKDSSDAFENKNEEKGIIQLDGNNQFTTRHRDPGLEKSNKFERHFCRKPHHFYEDSSKQDFNYSDGFLDRKKEILGLPLDFEKTRIHDFTVKIEKVVGIPLFTGDNDMDCYVDYNFPKLDCSGKMVFDKVTNGTGIQMALRETEFKAVNRHKMRLNCKLTRALMTLPVHEITFSVWGRYYRPRPRDYMLGKAILPLMKLSNLELVYCQQRKREAIFEKIIIPITVVESSVTNGYTGSFGDLHVILGYSCASATSYKEWKDLGKEYFSGHEIFDRSEGNCIHSFNDRNIPLMNFDHYKEQDNRKINRIPDKLKPDFTQATKISSRNRIVNSPDFIQSNVHVKKFPNYHDFKKQTIEKSQDEQLGTVKDFDKNIPINGNNAVSGTLDARDSDLESIFNSHGKEKKSYALNGKNLKMESTGYSNRNELHEFNGLNAEIPSAKGTTNLGNLVEEVLCDMKGRQADKNMKQKSPVTIQETVPKVSDSRACDAFEHFDLKVDLPSREESMDFEARSQYSFLCSPPHLPHYFSNQHNYVRLESDSSFSMKDTTQNPINPFSSLSNMSFSINSDSSMFKVQEEGNIPFQTNSSANLKNNRSSINEKIKGERDSFLLKSNHDIPNVNEDNNKRVQRNMTISSGSEKDDTTLKSLESLKIFKEEYNGRESKDIGVETDFVTQNKDTQTSYTSYKEEQFFKVRVQICRALGLPSVEVRQPNAKIAMVKPTSYAYFSAMMDGKPRILKTKVVEKKSNPIWNESWDVDLPVDFLKKCDRELEVFVDLNGGTEEPDRGSDCSSQWPIVLRTGVDLTPITAGLEHASGWFSLSDRSLFSRAQLKVVVTPLEDVSPFRDDWLKEYTKAKGRKIEINVPDSSSIATSLQEKLKELEKLTERMKNKMNDRPNWKKSPPFDLLAEVQAVRLSRDQINFKSCESDAFCYDSSWSGNVQRVETATSPIIVDLDENDDSPPATELNNCSAVIDLEDEEEKGGTCTYTVDVESGSSNNDSLETPSETIDRILLKMRSKR